jgi:hypothetical protein
MVKNTLQQVAIPNLSGYLQQMTEANKAITESFGNFGKAAERYQTRQSDAYNNPLIDRLNRAATQQEFNQVSDSIDSTLANPLLRQAQTTGIQKYQNLNNKIQQQQLSNQFDTTDLTQLPTVKNLYDNETDPNKKLQYGALYSKLVNNQQNFTNTKRNLEFSDKASTDILDGSQELTYNDASTPQDLKIISVAKAKLINDKQTRALANIGNLNTPSLFSSSSSATQNTNTGVVNYDSIYNPNDPATTSKVLSVLNAGENGNGTIPDRKGSQYQGNFQLGNDIVADNAKILGVTPGQIRSNPELQKQTTLLNNEQNAKIFKNTLGTEPTVKQVPVLHQQGGAGGTELYKPENADEPAYIVLSKFSNIDKAREKVLANGGRLDMTAKEFTDHIENYYVSKDQEYNGKPNNQSKIVGDTTTTNTPELINRIRQNASQQVQQKYAPRLAALNSLPVTKETIAETKKQITESRNFERRAIAEQIFKTATTPKTQNRLLTQMGITEPKELSVISNYLKEYNSSNLIPRADAELPVQVKNTVDIINADAESAKQTITNSNKIIADSEGYLKTVKKYSSLPNAQAIINKAITENVNSGLDPKDKLNATTNLSKTVQQLRSKLNEGSDYRLYNITDAQAVAAIESSIGYSDGGWFSSEEFVPNLDRAVSFLENNATADSKAITLEKQNFTNASDKLKKLTDRIESIQIDISNNNNVDLPIDKEVLELNKLHTQIKNLKRTDPVLNKSLNPNERGLPKTDTAVTKTQLEQDVEKAQKEGKIVDPNNTQEYKYSSGTQKLKDIIKSNNVSILRRVARGNSDQRIIPFEEFKQQTILVPILTKTVSGRGIAGSSNINTRTATESEKKSLFDYLKNNIKPVNNSKTKTFNSDNKIEHTNRLKLVDRIVNK